MEGQYEGALRGRCSLAICTFASCHLPISSAKTIYQQSLSCPEPMCTHEFAFEKTAAELRHLHSANESCTVVCHDKPLLTLHGHSTISLNSYIAIPTLIYETPD